MNIALTALETTRDKQAYFEAMAEIKSFLKLASSSVPAVIQRWWILHNTHCNHWIRDDCFSQYTIAFVYLLKECQDTAVFWEEPEDTLTACDSFR